MRTSFRRAASIFMAIGILTALTSLGASPRSYAVAPATLSAGSILSAGQFLQSPNGTFTAKMGTDGNFVVYSGATAVWATNTAVNTGAYVKMQTDGNLVVYSSAGKALWWCCAAGGGGSYLKMQDDGNLVVYTPGGAAVWSRIYGLVNQAVQLGMPFTGGWSTYVNPATHPVYFGGSGTTWATDLYAVPGTPVKAVTASGSATFRVTSAGALVNCFNSSNQRVSAGDYVLADVFVNGSKVGVALWEHLNGRTVSAGATFGSGTILGYTAMWGWSSCWQVNNNAGVHVHFEASGCYIARSSGAVLSEGTAIGRMGSGLPKQCP